MKYSMHYNHPGEKALVSGKSMKFVILLHSLVVVITGACSQPVLESDPVEAVTQKAIATNPMPGIYRIPEILPKVEAKNVGIVANHTSLIGKAHLVDTLLSRGVDIGRIFAPEHGFRGDQADGATVENGVDPATGLQVVSLYGKNKKPQPAQIEDLDVVIFDVQDVGARFYTYLSTLHYVMEACAEENVPLIVLDRPNPNAHYIDGPVLKPGYESFVGMHPVPVVYGMTIGEYALMINGEKWLKNGVQCKLDVFTCLDYTHHSFYSLPVKPSPNLPDMQSVYLYPSLCFFEGTQVSVGRGTEMPFSVIGEPSNTAGDFTFTPRPIAGASTSPPQNGKECRGYDLRSVEVSKTGLQIEWLIRMYRESQDKDGFFLKSMFIDKLAGDKTLRLAIIQNTPQAEIEASWQTDIDAFKLIRSQYLLYD